PGYLTSLRTASRGLSSTTVSSSTKSLSGALPQCGHVRGDGSDPESRSSIDTSRASRFRSFQLAHELAHRLLRFVCALNEIVTSSLHGRDRGLEVGAERWQRRHLCSHESAGLDARGERPLVLALG